MRTALQPCVVRDGPANLGDGPELLEPARCTVALCIFVDGPLAIARISPSLAVDPSPAGLAASPAPQGLPVAPDRQDSFSFGFNPFSSCEAEAEVENCISFVKTEVRCNMCNARLLVRPVVESHSPRSHKTRRKGLK